MRSRRCVQVLFENMDHMPASWQSFYGADNARQRQHYQVLLQRSIQQLLTPRQRQVLQLYYLEEKTIPEIARQLHVNKSTVSRTLHRAKHRLISMADLCQVPASFYGSDDP